MSGTVSMYNSPMAILRNVVATSEQGCFARVLLIVTLSVVGVGCGESDVERCGERPTGPAYPADSSYSECGISVCGGFYEYICHPGDTSWATYVQDCNCGPQTPQPPSMVCNPVTQAGCSFGEKCASLVLTESPWLSQVACVPDGAETAGQPCSDGEAGQLTGYDNCTAGYDCFESQCRAICQRAPDSCDGTSQTDGALGEACASLGGHLGENAGVCLPMCDPSLETISDGIILNPSCEFGTCSLDISNGISTCSEAPPDAALATQNHAPISPSNGSEFPRACAPGFSDLLRSQNNPNGSPLCARYCTPEDSYLGSVGVIGNAQGLRSECESGNLDILGGRNNHEVEHQCRHIQTLVSGADAVSADIGMCVPIVPIDNGALLLVNGAQVPDSFGDCSLFDWLGLKEAWNDAAPNGYGAAQQAFDDFCLSNPDNPFVSQVYSRCQGFFFGCVGANTLAQLTTPIGP